MVHFPSQVLVLSVTVLVPYCISVVGVTNVKSLLQVTVKINTHFITLFRSKFCSWDQGRKVFVKSVTGSTVDTGEVYLKDVCRLSPLLLKIWIPSRLWNESVSLLSFGERLKFQTETESSCSFVCLCKCYSVWIPCLEVRPSLGVPNLIFKLQKMIVLLFCHSTYTEGLYSYSLSKSLLHLVPSLKKIGSCHSRTNTKLLYTSTDLNFCPPTYTYHLKYKVSISVVIYKVRWYEKNITQ